MQQLKESHAVTIRQPATANLMLDSVDRSVVYPLANQFQISKPQALLNGFFHRIGTTEMVLEWTTPNIQEAFDNDNLYFDLSGTTTGTITTYIPLAGAGEARFYTAYDVIQAMALLIGVEAQAAGITPLPVTAAQANPTGVGGQITFTQPVYVRFPAGAVQRGLGLNTDWFVFGPGVPLDIFQSDLRGIRYLDFISPQLTYNQDLKDAATNKFVRDVLARWYMTYDQPAPTDAYGLPIYMGMEPFIIRRIFSPPKQIRWDNIQPVGNVAFEVYTDQGILAPFQNTTNWLMTLQVSED